ncbi:hypothetical protein JTB14_003012 [Gonioctena quinquepunctata]|nr:hypothetical protein JTB14_003012 [Gonioctena quinquepunctata]
MRPVFNYILLGLFFAFILKSVYSLYSIFQTPDCNNAAVCYKSILNTKPKLDLYVFVSDNSKSGNFDEVLYLDNFDYNSQIKREVSLELSKSARNNGSLFIHTIIVPSNSIIEEASIHNLVKIPESTYVKSRLTKYAVPISASFNLLKDESKTASMKPVSHLRSNYPVIMCTEYLDIPHDDIPMELVRQLRVTRNRQVLPLCQADVLNMRLKDLVEITPETKRLNLTYVFSPVSFGKMRFLLQIETTLREFMALGFTEKDLDEVKGVFADSNLYLLCATMFIGSIHLLLDFLSFKNDVSFWKSQTSMAGLSTRTVLWRAFSQTIVFLYLLDEGTSLLVLVPSGIATLIEFWKVSKVYNTSISWRGLKFDKDRKESNDEKKTREYDEECMKYLSYLLYPLCIGSAVYSLLYQPHRSWYSWTINSLVNGVYAFGFIFMLPQLFINYRLKSVAALPWRAFTYRAFNTFIDDIFAFIITMPMAHRVACFRDDVVFLVYLYQRWLYPVDKTRTDDVVGEVVPEGLVHIPSKLLKSFSEETTMKNKPEYYTRAGKSNVTLRKFFNNLKDNDLHYENQQITQCVFLGVLRLKPVPTVFSSNNTPPGCSAEADNKPRRFRNNNSNKEVNKNLSRKKNINKVISGKIRKKNPEKIKASVKKVPVKKNIIKIKLNMKKKQSTTPPEQTPTDSPSDLTPSLSLEPVTSSPTFNPVVNLFNKLKQQIESKHNLPGPSGLLDSTKDCAKPQQHTPSVFELNTNKQPPAKAKKAKKSGKKRSIIFERLAMPLLPASHDVKFGTDSSGCKEDSLSSLTSNLSNSSIDEQDIANKPTESVAVGQEVPKITKQKERTSPRNKLPTSKMLCDDEVYCLNDEAAIVQDTPEITVNDVIIIPDIVAEEPSKDSSQNDVIVIDEPKGPRLSPRTRQLQEQKEESPITNLSREPKENASVDTSADTGENRKSNCSETANTSNNSDSLEKPRRRRRLMPTAIPSIFFNTPMLLRSELAQKKSDAPEKKTNPRGSSRLLRSEPNRQEKTQKGRKSTSLERFQSSNEDAQSKNYEENENLIYEVVKPAASATTQSLSLPESLTSTSNEVICLDEASPKVEPLIIKLKVSQQRNSETSPKKNHVSHENQAKEESEKQKNVELAKKNISPKKSRVKPLPEANVSTEMKRLFPQDKSSEISLSVDLSNPSPVKNAPPKKSVEKDSTKLEENVSKSQTAVKSTSLKKSIAKVPSKAIEIDLVEDTDVAKKKNNNNEEGVQLKGSSNPRSKTGKKIQENVVEDVILIPDDNQSNVMILSNQTNELPLKKSAEAPKKSKQSNQLLQKNIENENDTAAIDVDSEDNEEKYVKVLPETMEICSRSERNEKTFSDVQKQITVHSDLRLDIKSDTDIKSDAEEKSDVEIVEFVPKMTRSAIARGNKTKSKGDTSQDGQSNEKSDPKETSEVEIVGFIPKMTRNTVVKENATKMNKDTKPESEEKSEVEVVELTPEMSRSTVAKESGTKTNPHTSKGSQVNPKSDVEIIEFVPKMTRSALAKENETKMNMNDNQTDTKPDSEEKSDVEIIEFVPKMTRSALAKENGTKMNIKDNETDTKPDSEEKSDVEIVEFVQKMTRSALAKENETKINMKGNQTNTKPDSEEKSEVEVVEIVPKMTRSSVAKDNATKTNVETSRAKSDMEIVEFIPKKTRSSVAKKI